MNSVYEPERRRHDLYSVKEVNFRYKLGNTQICKMYQIHLLGRSSSDFLQKRIDCFKKNKFDVIECRKL